MEVFNVNEQTTREMRCVGFIIHDEHDLSIWIETLHNFLRKVNYTQPEINFINEEINKATRLLYMLNNQN